MRKIVLTGGPGAGKTVITRQLATSFPDRFVVVPEAATQVYSMLNTRWDKLDTDRRRDVQRKIYFHQLQQEEAIAQTHPSHILLLDRGTIDGAAYWPDGPAEYWLDLKTTLPAELNRYHTVVWLETAAALGIYDGEESNPVRFEDAAGAVKSGEKLLDLWGSHPNLKHVGAFHKLDDKIAAVLEMIG